MATTMNVEERCGVDVDQSKSAMYEDAVGRSCSSRLKNNEAQRVWRSGVQRRSDKRIQVPKYMAEVEEHRRRTGC
jgi:hypothetical protein